MTVPSLESVLLKIQFELVQLAQEDDFNRGLRIANLLVLLRGYLEAPARWERQKSADAK